VLLVFCSTTVPAGEYLFNNGAAVAVCDGSWKLGGWKSATA
jgi:hypothetical protein